MLRTAAALLLSAGAALLAGAQQVDFDPALVGTWSSKSGSTLTGPGLYDPVNEKFTEPAHTGISYSFTLDGFWESAYFRAIANPVNPNCPKAMIQWQHGSYTRFANGSLHLIPFAPDGRQLLSDHCTSDYSIYTRFNVSELMKGYAIYPDPYSKVTRLDLVRFDGSYIMPLYLSYTPPTMLPTTTLNPLVTPTAAGKSRVKRDVEDEVPLPLNHKVLRKRSGGLATSWHDWAGVETVGRADGWWWFGVLATGAGGVLYFCF